MKRTFVALLLLSVLASCSNKLHIVDEAFETKNLPYIKDSITSKDEIILKLGEPAWTFENGRIFTYRISIDKKGNVIPLRNYHNRNDSYYSYNYYSAGSKYYCLVLIFDENKTLKKHSLLFTNP